MGTRFDSLYYLVSDGFVVEHGGLDLQRGGHEDELHEGELVAALQRLRLHLHISPVDPVHSFNTEITRICPRHPVLRSRNYSKKYMAQ